MLTVGDTFPDFALTAVVDTAPGKEFAQIDGAQLRGGWAVVFFWPMDFTFVCPTEIAGFGQRHAEFQERKTKVLGVSTDTQYVHLAWRTSHPDLKTLPFPMVADTKRELSSALGILHREDGVPLRATFIVDEQGVIRHVSVNDLSAGRNIDETLRILDALQSGELTPCGWHKGEATLTPAA
ncbi:MAG TPA: peroxiredoxin [Nannocystaceae bacterium]|nr:peroxiredoxin [Nannocystaceae bacterium]